MSESENTPQSDTPTERTGAEENLSLLEKILASNPAAAKIAGSVGVGELRK